jgi:hypothetical protein
MGIDVAAAAVTTPAFKPGARVVMSDGTEWIYCSIGTSVTIIQYAAYAIASAGNSNTAVVALTSTIGLRGCAIVIAQQAVTSDASNIQYAWFLMANPFGNTSYKVRVAASCAIDAKLATTANAGTLDDTTAGTVLRIDGIVLTDSQPAGSSGSRTFRTSGQPLGWGAV